MCKKKEKNSSKKIKLLPSRFEKPNQTSKYTLILFKTKNSRLDRTEVN